MVHVLLLAKVITVSVRKIRDARVYKNSSGVQNEVPLDIIRPN